MAGRDRGAIAHVFDGPWYGPAENAFNTFNKDLPEFSHLFVDVSPLRDGFEPDAEWCEATGAVQQRADQHVVPHGSMEEALEGAYAAILYDADVVVPDGVRSVRWTFDGRQADITAVPWISPGERVPPLLDYDRLIGMAGRVTKPTIGVFWDPHSEEPLHEAARLALDAAPEGSRVVYTESGDVVGAGAGGIVAPEGREAVGKRWEIGFDWMYCSLCDAVVARAGDMRYPFLLASSMAMGKACVAVSAGGPLPPFVRDRVTCLVAGSCGEAASMAAWLLSRPEKARRIGAAAQFAVATEDKDGATLSLRRILFDGKDR